MEITAKLWLFSFLCTKIAELNGQIQYNNNEVALCQFARHTNIKNLLTDWYCVDGEPVHPICEGSFSSWTGIKCQEGNIVSINLKIIGLSGTISSSLGMITTLQDFQIFGDDLNPEIPAEVCGKSLIRFDVYYSENNYHKSKLVDVPDCLVNKFKIYPMFSVGSNPRRADENNQHSFTATSKFNEMTRQANRNLAAPPPNSGPTQGVPPAPASPTKSPSIISSFLPTKSPSKIPTTLPSSDPSILPTELPTATSTPTSTPTVSPSLLPTDEITAQPTSVPTEQPTWTPTYIPTSSSGSLPSNSPQELSSSIPSYIPSTLPSTTPSVEQPSIVPSNLPSSTPTNSPTSIPHNEQGGPPSLPSSNGVPSLMPAVTSILTTSPTQLPSLAPSASPTIESTTTPSHLPTSESYTTSIPTIPPTELPSWTPSSNPTALPTSNPLHGPPTTANPPTGESPFSSGSPQPSTPPSSRPSSTPTVASDTPTTNPQNSQQVPPNAMNPTLLPVSASTDTPSSSSPSTRTPTDPPTNSPNSFGPTATPIAVSVSVKPSSVPTKSPTRRPGSGLGPPPNSTPTTKPASVLGPPTVTPTTQPVSGLGPPPTVTPTTQPVSGLGPPPNSSPSAQPVSVLGPPTVTPTTQPVSGLGPAPNSTPTTQPVSGLGPPPNSSPSAQPVSSSASPTSRAGGSIPTAGGTSTPTALPVSNGQSPTSTTKSPTKRPSAGTPTSGGPPRSISPTVFAVASPGSTSRPVAPSRKPTMQPTKSTQSVTINSLSDGNSGVCGSGSSCNLRAAWLTCTNSMSCSLNFPVNATVSLTSSLTLTVTDNRNIDITINGNGATITSNQASRFLYLQNTYTSTSNIKILISNLTLYNFKENSNGGCIYIDKMANVTLSHITFQSNKASAGGALYMSSSKDITIEYCTFTSNTAMFDTGAGIYLEQYNYYITITKSEFTSNFAKSGGAGIYMKSYNYYLTISDSTFYENTANSDGGAVVFFEYNSYITLTNNVLDSNGCSGRGGAVFFNQYNTYITMENCTIKNQQNINLGAGLFLSYYNDHFTLKNTKFQSNFASVGGGGAYISTSNYYCTIEDCEFESNSASTGAAFISYSKNYYLNITNCMFKSNSGTVSGGAISISNINYNITITNSQFLNNTSNGQGGAIFLESKCIYCNFMNNKFQQNSATWRGGAVSSVLYNNYNTFQSCTFTGNTAVSYGGAIYLGDANDYNTITDCTFSGNSATYYGGAVYVLQYHQSLSITNSNFYSNTGSNGGGLFISFINSGITISNCLLTGNTVSNNGGGMYFDSGNLGIVISDVTFSNNIATVAGGGLYSYETNEISTVNTVLFNNIAKTGNGGGMVLYQGHTTFSMRNCNLTNNYANAGSGGSMALDGYNNNNYTIQNSYFHKNYAYLYGGSIYTLNLNTMTVSGCQFDSNNAVSFGGGVYMDTVTLLTFSDVQYTKNIAELGGGGAYITGSTSVLIASSTFEKNSVSTLHGSSIVLSASTDVMLSSNTFLFNNVSEGGGTVYWEAGSMTEPTGLTLDGTAAVIPATMTTPEKMTQMNISDKSNDRVLSVLSDSAFPKSPYTSVAGNTWSENAASYGSKWATNVVSIFVSPTVEVSRYSAYFPSLTVTAKDIYQQTVTTESGFCAIKLYKDNYCVPNSGYVTGATTLAMKDGVATFTAAQGACIPGGSMTIQFTYGASITNTTTLYFPRCRRGDYYANQLCVQCPTGKYSLIDNWNNTVTTCSTCPTDVDSCFGDKIILQSGQWRISELAETYFSCPYGSKACIGGNTTGNTSCSTGYTGPLCSVCDVGYYGSTNLCRSCSGDGGLNKVIWGMFFFAVVVLVIIYFIWARRHDEDFLNSFQHNYNIPVAEHEVVQPEALVHANKNNNIKGSSHSINIHPIPQEITTTVPPPPPNPLHANISYEIPGAVSTAAEAVQARKLDVASHVRDVELRINNNRKQNALVGLQAKFKIILAIYQITSNIQSAVETSLPSPLHDFLDYLGFLNFSFLRYLPFSCVFRDSDYISQLEAVTLAPLLILGFLIVSFFIQYVMIYYKYSKEVIPSNQRTDILDEHVNDPSKPIAATITSKSHLFNRMDKNIKMLGARYLALFLLMTFLVLPGISTIIVNSVLCENLDPDNVVAGSSYYLSVDMSIHCESSRYFYGVYWAVAMAFVYPVGIPLFYLVLLVINREKIKNRNVHDENNFFDDNDKSINNTNTTNNKISVKKRTISIGGDDNASNTYATNNKHSRRKSSGNWFRHFSFLTDIHVLRSLYQFYQPKYWFWEVVESSRRLVLTAVLSVISTNTYIQIFFGILVSIGYCKLYGLIQPYRDPINNMLQEFAQYQILLVFIAALMIKFNVFVSFPWTDYFIGYFLLCYSIFVIVLTLHYGWEEFECAYLGHTEYYKKKQRKVHPNPPDNNNSNRRKSFLASVVQPLMQLPHITENNNNNNNNSTNNTNTNTNTNRIIKANNVVTINVQENNKKTVLVKFLKEMKLSKSQLLLLANERKNAF